MKELIDFKEDIHKCSRCGLCQASCPLYKETGNDCAISRGQFLMLEGILKGKFKMSDTVNKYLDMCLKCNACSKFCPSGINVVDVIVSAKYEYFKIRKFEKIKSFIQKYLIFGLGVKILSLFTRYTKSKTFSKKVLYFGGCGSKVLGDKTVVKLLNSLKIEVINPKFHCCGVYLFARGDLKGFQKYIKSFVDLAKKYNIDEIVTSCATCEKTIKSYAKWTENEEEKAFLNNLKIKNLYVYIRENNLKFRLKKQHTVTYHKPCNLENFDDVLWILNNTENLNYTEMKDYDVCCGLNGLTKISEYKIMKKIFANKYNNILNSKAKYVLTSCLGCIGVLTLISKGKYKACDLLEFISKRI